MSPFAKASLPPSPPSSFRPATAHLNLSLLLWIKSLEESKTGSLSSANQEKAFFSALLHTRSSSQRVPATGGRGGLGGGGLQLEGTSGSGQGWHPLHGRSGQGPYSGWRPSSSHSSQSPLPALSGLLPGLPPSADRTPASQYPSESPLPGYHAGGAAGRGRGALRAPSAPLPRGGVLGVRVSTPARLLQRGLAEFSVGEAHQAAAVTAGPAYGSHLRGAGGQIRAR